MLSKKYNLADAKKIGAYEPFPRYGDKTWKSVDPTRAKQWIGFAEQFLVYQWPAITAEMYMTLKTTGSLRLHWDRYRERRSALGMLMMAECLEGKGRFINQVVNGVISFCEEASWNGPLSMTPKGNEIPDDDDHEVDLCSSETAVMLAWIDYLLGDEIDKKSPRVRKRIKSRITDRILKPYLDTDDYWWMGFNNDRTNNWNPWCNTNIILCALLIDVDPDIKARCLYKVFRSLDSYVEAYSEDGCCDEGPMYWGAAGGGLYVALEILHEASKGAINVFDHEKLHLIGQYITKVFIDGEYFVDYADGDAIVDIDEAIFRFGKAIGDEGMMRLGASGVKDIEPRIFDWFQPYGIMRNLFREDLGETSGNYPLQSWLWKASVMNAREFEGSPKGFFVSAKGGHNLESHNHNDLGNFIVYLNGKPLFIDIGTEEYSVKTFSPQRFEIWYLRSDYHNCFQVSGIDQMDGGEFFAQDVECIQNESKSMLSMELKHAYPAESGIKSWKREIALNREDQAVVVTDDFALDKPRPIKRFLITTTKPEVDGQEIKFTVDGEAVCVKLDHECAHECVIEIEEIPIEESRLYRNWGGMMYRIVLSETAQSGKRMMVIKR